MGRAGLAYGGVERGQGGGILVGSNPTPPQVRAYAAALRDDDKPQCAQ